MKTINVGIIGGGLMGREVASALGRWFVLNDYPVKVVLKAVCDINEEALKWYEQIPTIDLLTTEYKALLNSPNVDVVYVALPHHLHEEYYLKVLEAGKDLFAEKPFGIDLEAAEIIKNKIDATGRFVRCSSEMPYFPGGQRVIKEILSGRLGKIIEVKAGFCHSSDMDPLKPINWKRQSKFCGAIGVMGDLGMHIMHIPLRMGWKPSRVYAQLQKIVTKRSDGKGGWSECDTWNNAHLSSTISIEGEDVPMMLEMKRLAPGETNSWYIEVLGTEGGVKYSTKDTKVFWKFTREKEQVWQRVDLGFQVPFSTITGGIFEPGFTDCFMQMLAAYFAEREGFLDGRLGCVTPEEAVMSHQVFAAALASHKTKAAVVIP
ncbi:Gfo/Idh/MocA family oxidoreductase [uncultured Cyclobacterium sp.]|uniref:Gfo/Idh/MocA family protein n=1 Tax=uncultured Cyclobacterium sp. TaxID=453820 RepID=UPI0030ECF8F8|tara:strand:+ start:20744 stop:21868 length:1125 start_codon:yes stop_codon:yes gene_type:complete